jgi:hypothetical protein
MRILPALLVAISASAVAQGPGSGDLRAPQPSSPPAHEPAQPGEPPAKAAPGSAAPADNRTRQAADRCDELAGTTREQCLLEQQDAAAGASSAPVPRTAPPPQNPR